MRDAFDDDDKPTDDAFVLMSDDEFVLWLRMRAVTDDEIILRLRRRPPTGKAKLDILKAIVDLKRGFIPLPLMNALREMEGLPPSGSNG